MILRQREFWKSSNHERKLMLINININRRSLSSLNISQFQRKYIYFVDVIIPYKTLIDVILKFTFSFLIFFPHFISFSKIYIALNSIEEKDYVEKKVFNKLVVNYILNKILKNRLM